MGPTVDEINLVEFFGAIGVIKVSGGGIVDKVYFKSHSFIKYMVDYIHHLVIHDVLYSIRHLMNEWMGPKVHFFP